MLRPKLNLNNVGIFDEKLSKLPQFILPSVKDVILAAHYAKQTEFAPWKVIKKQVVLEVCKIWKKASIPTIADERSISTFNTLHQEFLGLLNTDKTRKEKTQYVEKVAAFRVSLSRLGLFCLRQNSMCFFLVFR